MTNNITDSYGNPVPEWHHGYFRALKNQNFRDILNQNLTATPRFLCTIDPLKENYAYQSGKWTLKEVLIHIIDCERILAYRALRFARNDKTDLPGFEENDYVPFSEASHRSMQSVINEYEAVRKATIELFSNFSDAMMARTGTANKMVLSVEMTGTIIAGHEQHHLKIIRERYLV